MKSSFFAAASAGEEIVEARPAAIRGRLREEAKSKIIPLSIRANVVPKFRTMPKKATQLPEHGKDAF